MASLHPSLNMKTGHFEAALNMKAGPFEAAGTSSAAASKDRNIQSVEQLVLDLCDPDLRENSLLELSKVFSFSSPFLFQLFLICLLFNY